MDVADPSRNKLNPGLHKGNMNQPYRTYTPSKRTISLNTNSASHSTPTTANTTQPTTTRISTPPPPSVSPSTSQPPSSQSNKSNQVPFRPGFQPRGIYRDRTGELITLRSAKQETKRLEESRLQKRLEKLIELHFPFEASHPISNPPADSDHQNHSSILQLSNTLLGMAKSLTNQSNEPSAAVGGLNLMNQNHKLRLKEQSIVRWQDDDEVKECKFCHTRFGLRVRKHHCRLCGSVVCFNPTWATGRSERCSTMIRFEWDPNLKFTNGSRGDKYQNEKSIRGKIVQLTDQEIGTIDQPHSSLRDLISAPTHLPSKSPLGPNCLPPNTIKPDKAVRVCSHCLAIVLRRQAMTSPARIPHYIHVYANLKRIQDQIEHTLPEFQELVTSSKSVSTSSTPSKLLTLRKKLLTDLTLFDSYSKELSAKLMDFNPQNNVNAKMTNKCDGKEESASEIRLIKAITTRAGFFLRDHMSLIRSLGLLDLNPTPSASGTNSPNPKNLKKNTVQQSQTKQSTSHQKSAEESTAVYYQQDLTKYQHERSISVDSRFESDSHSERNQELIKLNVLLEQENLIESYLIQARQKRQLEDVASLTNSLEELRKEISSLKKTLL